ncbi:penicillin-binding protein [Micromonospora pattaloongensis]|uniref:penicillin-binding protein n=1 Tax=Micromonospora pattaloongensis TaxID=405436 RepID=UPI001FE15167|nr:transglycosylase domain-containing protein [Micromonospora pattaloongensis]
MSDAETISSRKQTNSSGKQTISSRKRSPLLVCGLLAGVAVAAAAFPAVAVSGLAVKAGAETFEGLPGELTTKQAPQATEVYTSDGETLLARFADENRRDVPLADVAPIMRQAIVAAEDRAFYRHNGIDAKGIARAFVANNSGSLQQGASTLTMQFVRMSITYAATDPAAIVAASEDTGVRKIREARLAIQIEKRLSKDEILERYLNLAPFGNGTYGIYAASQFYFRKQPHALGIDEAAMIAGLVKSPSEFNPLTEDGARATLQRRNWVLEQMRETGVITLEEAAAAQASTLHVRGEAPPNGCLAARPNHWGFFCDYFYRWWLAQPAFGITTYDRERRLKGGGYRVVTTLDARTQAAARRNVHTRLRDADPAALMVAAIEPGTGRVRALAANRTFALDNPAAPRNGLSANPPKARKGIRGSYPRTTNPIVTGGGDIAGYQAGSTFKIFTLIAALQNAYPLDYTINAPRIYQSKYTGASGAAACPHSRRYCPRNADDGMAGVHNAWTAFGSSVNTYFVPLQERVGAANVVDVARRLGITFRAPKEAALADDPQAANGWGAFTLGVSATTPLEVANAYATLAADGRFCQPTPVQEIRDSRGADLPVAAPACVQTINREVARAALDAARCPVGDKSAFGECRGATEPRVRRVVRHPVAGKTGTTDRDRTAAMVATTRSLAVAGILADPDWPETTRKMSHRIVNPAVYRTLAAAMAGRRPQDFPRPEPRLAYGDQVAVPDVTCKSVAEATALLTGAGFQVEVEARPVPSGCPANTVAGTEPSGWTVAGGVVVMRVVGPTYGGYP